MKTIRSILMVLAMMLVSSPIIAQGLFNAASTRGAGLLSGQLPGNSRFNLEIGTGFTSFSSGVSMFGNYVSPSLELDLSPSFTIIAGGSFSYNQYNNLPNQSLVQSNRLAYNAPWQQNMTGNSMFVSGRYMINENLVMTGTIYREEGHLPLMMMNQGFMNTMNQGLMDYRNHGMSMDLQYRITNNLHFGAGVSVNRTNNPWSHYSPFSDPFGSHRSRQRHFPY